MSSDCSMDSGSDGEMEVFSDAHSTVTDLATDGNVASVSVAGSQLAALDTTVNAEERCGSCLLPYGGERTVHMSQCGHQACDSCVTQGCSKCDVVSEPQPAYHLMGRDLMSPEPLDLPGTSGRNGDSTDQSDKIAAPLHVAAPLPAAAAPMPAAAAPMPAAAAPMPAAAAPMPATAAPMPATAAPMPATAAPKRAAAPMRAFKAKQPAQAGAAGESTSALVTVKCLNGTTLVEKIDPVKVTVGAMKNIVQQKSGISRERQHLLHKGKTMSDESKPVSSYGVNDGATLQMASRCYGG